MTKSVECLLSGGQDLYHLALLHTGLIRLARAGVLALRFREPQGRERSWSDDAHTMLLCRSGKLTWKVAVDLYDRGNRWQEELLRDCDVYLKRSYCPKEVSLQREAAKIKALGLNYAARPAEAPWRSGLAAGWPWLKRFVAGPKDWRQEINRARQYLASPLDQEFERPPSRNAEATIVFQPRLWELGSTDDDVDAVNGLRVAIVRLLKKEFGRRFAGGLVPTPLARQRYPELLTPAPVERGAYVAFSLRNAIAINSRGLHDSIPFKMGEYLAGSFAILSDPMRYVLPEPLRAGIEYDLYRSAEECATHCERLLADPAELQHRREAAWGYYQKYVRAEALWGRRLQEVWGE